MRISKKLAEGRLQQRLALIELRVMWLRRHCVITLRCHLL
jgi:hypothetical protein